MNYRSNVQSVVTDIRSLNFTAQHIKAMRKTPFWNFIETAMNMRDVQVFSRFKKRDQNIARILQ